MISGPALIRPQISRIVQKGRRLLGMGLPPRHHNDYATHVPVLLGIASAFQIAKILEFGAGFYSTLTFLNPLAFPDVLLVDSIESDSEWMSKISNAAAGDPRLRMRLVPEPIEDVLPEIPLDNYDLILVDSSTEASKRASLIEDLAGRQSFSALVAVHDFEIMLYRSAAKNFRNRVEYCAYNPCTGIMWQGESVRAGTLKKLSRTIQRYSKRLQPDDVESWSEIFRREMRIDS